MGYGRAVVPAVGLLVAVLMVPAPAGAMNRSVGGGGTALHHADCQESFISHNQGSRPAGSREILATKTWTTTLPAVTTTRYGTPYTRLTGPGLFNVFSTTTTTTSAIEHFARTTHTQLITTWWRTAYRDSCTGAISDASGGATRPVVWTSAAEIRATSTTTTTTVQSTLIGCASGYAFKGSTCAANAPPPSTVTGGTATATPTGSGGSAGAGTTHSTSGSGAGGGWYPVPIPEG